MQTLKIEVSNSIYEHIICFLQNLPKNLINISHEKNTENTNQNSIKTQIEELFENSNVSAFKEIKDPVSWQRNIHNSY